MCYPNDSEELLRIELMGKTMDAVFDAIAKPKQPKPAPRATVSVISLRKYERLNIMSAEDYLAAGDTKSAAEYIGRASMCRELIDQAESVTTTHDNGDMT